MQIKNVYSWLINAGEKIASIFRRSQQTKTPCRSLEARQRNAEDIAKGFVKYLYYYLLTNKDGSKMKSRETKKLQNHIMPNSPRLFQGKLYQLHKRYGKYLFVQVNAQSVSVYFDTTKTYTENSTVIIPRRRGILLKTLLRVLEKGAKIPVGVHRSPTDRLPQKYVIIPPRPFWDKAVNKFIDKWQTQYIVFVKHEYRLNITVTC